MAISNGNPTEASISISNTFLETIHNGRVASTCLLKLVRTVEAPMLLKTAGFDSILIDMEHSTFDLDTTSQLCIAALYAGITPIVRSPTKEPFFVSRILDGGALGVIVPHIKSAQDARDVVEASKFPPIGRRSATAGLPHLQFRPLPAKLASPALNQATMVIPMIETLESLDDLDAIASVPGIESLLIGGNDLTAEMGIPGQYDDPQFDANIIRVIQACKKNNIALGLGGLHSRPDLLTKYCGLGANWVLAGIDSGLLLAGATQTAQAMQSIDNQVAAARSKPLLEDETKTNGVLTAINEFEATA